MVEVVDLIRELGSADLKNRKDAINQIGEIGAKDPDGIVVAISPLVANLTSEDVGVRQETIKALTAIAGTKSSLIKGSPPQKRP